MHNRARLHMQLDTYMLIIIRCSLGQNLQQFILSNLDPHHGILIIRWHVAGWHQQCTQQWKKIKIAKVDNHSSVTPIFEWYVMWLQQWTPKRHEIGLPAQTTITIVCSILYTMKGDQYDHPTSTRIFTLIMNQIFKRASQVIQESVNGLDLVLLTPIVLIAWFIT
jgi:hypothetical protein